ncbi:hypothetical protein [Paracoccus beibuensis]|uniref:hypothetical protein n=1 Tax=Paracoccus beibuensis TaxID=547602 RepID=UPI002240793F|nr:hypothetical protein [Paracoccus beibuensis]
MTFLQPRKVDRPSGVSGKNIHQHPQIRPGQAGKCHSVVGRDNGAQGQGLTVEMDQQRRAGHWRCHGLAEPRLHPDPQRSQDRSWIGRVQHMQRQAMQHHRCLIGHMDLMQAQHVDGIKGRDIIDHTVILDQDQPPGRGQGKADRLRFVHHPGEFQAGVSGLKHQVAVANPEQDAVSVHVADQQHSALSCLFLQGKADLDQDGRGVDRQDAP